MNPRLLTVLIPALVGVTNSATAQMRASEAAVVSQTVDGTVITVEYSRPQMRGRPPQEDGVVHMEHMWTPGANWATTLEVSRPITLNGHAVAKGKYSLWAEPGPTTWTIHLHPKARLFHTAAPKAAEMMLSFPVTPTRGTEAVEVMTFDFPTVRQDGATLRFRWAQVVVPFEIAVEPTLKRVALTEAQVAPYVGGWLMQMYNEVNEKSPEMRMEVMLSNGSLRGVIDGSSPFGLEFIPTDKPHTFILAFTTGGKLFDVDPESQIEFEVTSGKAVGWKTKPIPGLTDEPWMWGRRRP
jgi:hypothetical protein